MLIQSRGARLFALCSFLAIQARGSESEPTLRDIANNLWQDQRAIVTSPSRMDRKDSVIWGATAVSMLTLMPRYNDSRSLDEKIVDGINRENPPWHNFFSRITYLGDGRVLFGASLASYGVGAWSDNAALQSGSAHWIEALAQTSVYVTLIKVLAGRARPTSNPSRSTFTGPWGYFSDQGVNSSFPSGHTALAFASAAVLTKETDSLWVGVPVYLTAIGVGFSRMFIEKHWFSDVIFGAALGQSLGSLVENRRHGKTEKTSWIEPMMDQNHVGLCWNKRW